MPIKIWYFIFLIIYPLSVISFLLYAKRKLWLRLDHRNLFQQKLFWISITIPLLTFLAFGIWAWWGKHPELSSKGFENFLYLSKLPLLFLASSVPLAAIVNNIHRTIQTEKQINESEKKNVLDSYYSHIKFHTDYFKSLPETTISRTIETIQYEKKFKVSYPIHLYNKLYPHSSPSTGAEYVANKRYTNQILSQWSEILKSLKKIDDLCKVYNRHGQIKIASILIVWHEIEINIIALCELMGVIYPNYPKSIMIDHVSAQLITSFKDLSEAYEIIDAIQFISIGIVDFVGFNTVAEQNVLDRVVKLTVKNSSASLLHNLVVLSCDVVINDYRPPEIKTYNDCQ